MKTKGEIRTYASDRLLSQSAAELIADLASRAIARHRRFSLALAGGSTPRSLYERLASREFMTRLDWSRTHFFWGDERCVPPDHPESNYRMAHQTLLDRVPVPVENVHRIRAEADPQQAAAEYERVLKDFFSSPTEVPRLAWAGEQRGETGGPRQRQKANGGGRTTEGNQRVEDQERAATPGKNENDESEGGGSVGRFDLILLGMGEDGHTASLFPATTALREQRRWVVAQFVERLNAWRITLTPAIINDAANVVFLVSGAGKAERLKHVLRGPYWPDAMPAQIVQPSEGRLLWLVDAAAAALL